MHSAAAGRSAPAPVDDLTSNRLLRVIVDVDPSWIGSRARRRACRAGEVLYDRGVEPGRVFFPVSGLWAVAMSDRDHHAVDVALVGRDGMVGLNAAIGRHASVTSARCRVSGTAYSVDADTFREALDAVPSFNRILQTYLCARVVIASQSVFCNRFHTMPQRLARYLLVAMDSLGSGVLCLPQHVIAEAIGVNRTAINAEAVKLRYVGAIDYRNGVISLVDRAALTAAACGCHQTITEESRAVVCEDGRHAHSIEDT